MSKSFKCPICGESLPLWFKLSSVIECKYCRSGLKTNGWSRLVSFLLLVPFLVGVIKASDGTNIIPYSLLALSSFMLMLLVLLGLRGTVWVDIDISG